MIKMELTAGELQLLQSCATGMTAIYFANSDLHGPGVILFTAAEERENTGRATYEFLTAARMNTDDLLAKILSDEDRATMLAWWKTTKPGQVPVIFVKAGVDTCFVSCVHITKRPNTTLAA